MTLRTEDQYKKDLRDGRRVFLAGEQIPDVTEDPYLKVGVETAAFDFRMTHDPGLADLAVTEDADTGEAVSSYFDVPDTRDAVRRRFDLVSAACRYAGGAIPFVKDVGSDILNGLTAVARGAGNERYAERIDAYRRHAAREDLALAGAVTDVKGDRSKPPAEQVSPDYYVRVVDETDDEIVVSGAKAHITASAYVDEIIVIPTRNLTEAEADYAVGFAVPVDTPGITQICRPSFRYEDRLAFPTPHPKPGHIEALVVFDEVRVPKERVFMHGDWQLAQAVAYAFSAFHRFTAVTYKIPIIEIMTGMAMLAAEANGIQKASHIRERYVNMIRYTETTKGLAAAAIAEAEEFHGSGLYVAKPLLSNMAKLHFASNFHEFVRDIQDIAGGLLVTQPTYRDWCEPELRPYLEQYLGGAQGFDAEDRLRLFSMLRHLAASDFSGWHEVCTIHAEGSLASQNMMLLAEAPLDAYKSTAREIVGVAQ